jgi:hypothetical protein
MMNEAKSIKFELTLICLNSTFLNFVKHFSAFTPDFNTFVNFINSK